MHIAICEEDHFEVAYTLVSLFNHSDNRITVFINEAASGQLKVLLGENSDHIKWHIKEAGDSNRQFIDQIFTSLKQDRPDLVWFSTIEHNFILYAHHIRKLRLKNLVLTVHGINAFMHSRPGFSLRKIIRAYGKRKLRKLIHQYVTLSEELSRQLSSQLPSTAKVYTVPGSFFDPDKYMAPEKKETEPWKLVVPGSVDSRRRDYEQVLNLLELAGKSGLDLEICLVGGIQPQYGAEILAKLKEYSRKFQNLRYFETEMVEQSLFDKEMENAHFVFMPTVKTTIISDGIAESYGRTSCSGNIGDMIRFARPFIAPEFLIMDQNFQHAGINYQGPADIINKLKQLGTENFKILANKSLEASKHYTIEEMRRRVGGLGFRV